MERRFPDKIIYNEIQYNVRISKRARYLRIEVGGASDVTVIVPHRARHVHVHDFISLKHEWVCKSITQIESKTRLAVAGTQEEFDTYKNVARTILSQKVIYWNQVYGFYYNKIFIKNMTTQWGSCSSKKNLNFNYKCIFLSEKQLDYIVVHELCHLKEMNHGKRFWELVEEALPDYRERVKEMKGIKLG